MFDTSLRVYLRERLGLKGTPLDLLVTIVGLSRNERGHSWASLAYLGMRIERAARTARSALSKLRSLGLVRTQATGRSLHCTPAWEALGLHPKDDAIPAPDSTPPNPPTEPAQEQAPPKSQAEPPPPPKASDPEAEAGSATDVSATAESVAPALAAIRERFGPEAERDIADLLNRGARSPIPARAADAALGRMLAVQPEHVKHSVGAYFRGLLGLAIDGRLSPASPSTREAPRCTDPLDAAVKSQNARVQSLKRQRERVELFSEEHRTLTDELNCATDELIRLRCRQDARDQARATPPPRQAPRPPEIRRTGPPPDWAQAYVPDADAAPSPT